MSDTADDMEVAAACMPEEAKYSCYDGSPCDSPSGDCNKCQWMMGVDTDG